MDLGKIIREQLRRAVETAKRQGGVNIASATNVGRTGHTTSVYSDSEVTIIQRDGETEVIHHRPQGDGAEDSPPAG